MENNSKPSAPKEPVDPYRANRELERWLHNGINMDSMPRPDQRGASDTYERLPTAPSLPADWEDRAELIGTIIYTYVRNEEGKIIDITQRFEYADNDQVENPVLEPDK